MIGRGGMGEVYRARDARLARDVALKILPDLGASDEQDRARFAREARALASLNHPNIAAIYGFEEHQDVASGPSSTGAIVMELVEGETRRGPLRDGDRRAVVSRGPAKSTQGREVTMVLDWLSDILAPGARIPR